MFKKVIGKAYVVLVFSILATVVCLPAGAYADGFEWHYTPPYGNIDIMECGNHQASYPNNNTYVYLSSKTGVDRPVKFECYEGTSIRNEFLGSCKLQEGASGWIPVSLPDNCTESIWMSEPGTGYETSHIYVYYRM